MLRLKIRRVVIAAFAISLLFLVALPIFLRTEVGSSLCPLSVDAQDNPCLSQDATISALQLSLIQGEGTKEALRGTIVAYEANLGISLQATNPAISFGFTETFDNNDRGWELTASDCTASRFSRGGLALSISCQDHAKGVFIPQIDNDQAFAEIEVTVPERYGAIGFIIGDDEQYQYLFISQQYYHWYIMLWDSVEQEFLYQTEYADRGDDLWTVDTPFTLAAEVRNGLFTMYLNGTSVEAIPITYGNRFGPAIYRYDDSFQAIFDNLVVRNQR